MNVSPSSPVPRFSLLHATRGRPEQCLATRDEWLARARHPELIEHIFSVDDDDSETIAAVSTQHSLVVCSKPQGCCSAYNLAAKAARGSIIVVVADDLHACDGWDEEIWKHLGDAVAQGLPRVLRVRNALCLGDPVMEKYQCEIFTRARYDQLVARHESLYHPGFHSMAADDDFWDQAVWDDVVIDAPDIHFEHRHYKLGAAAMDDTYRHTNAAKHYRDGWALYRSLHVVVEHDRRKVMIVTPIYLNDVCVQWQDSFVELLKAGARARLTLELCRTVGDTVNRQRNTLVANALARGMDFVLQIDSDMGYNPDDIIRWIRADLPMIGCNYPQRRYVWDNLAGKNPRTVAELQCLLLKGTAIGIPNAPTRHGFKECGYVGGGIVLTRRDVYLDIAKHGLAPKLEVYAGDLVPGGLDHLYRYYQFEVDSTGADVGEDYYFCDLVRRAGHKVYCDSEAIVSHTGPCTFTGRPAYPVAHDWEKKYVTGERRKAEG